MIITSERSHTMTYPYFDNDGLMKKVQIKPGDNEVDSNVWAEVKKQYKNRPLAYFKGIKEKAK